MKLFLLFCFLHSGFTLARSTEKVLRYFKLNSYGHVYKSPRVYSSWKGNISIEAFTNHRTVISCRFCAGKGLAREEIETCKKELSQFNLFVYGSLPGPGVIKENSVAVKCDGKGGTEYKLEQKRPF